MSAPNASLAAIDAVLQRQPSAEVADQLMALTRDLASTDAGLRLLVGRYADTASGLLLRVLAFHLSRVAPTAQGTSRNLVHTLADALAQTADRSALVNACTTIHRQAMAGPPWDPSDATAPTGMVTILAAALTHDGMAAETAVEALFAVRRVADPLALRDGDRQALRNALVAARGHVGADDVEELLGWV